MIKNIFLPEKLHSYYIFSRRIVAFEIGTQKVFATVIRAHRDKRFIQEFIEESYTSSEMGSLSAAITEILKKIKTYDTVYVALPSSAAVFKEIELPFTSLEKIKLVLPFEVESLLPFPLSEAVVDAIINGTDRENKTSHVFVAAVRKSTLEHYIDPFLQAGIQPDKVTIDTLELYGLMQHIADYQNQKGVSAFIDLNPTITRIILLVDGKIKTIRTLPQGIDEELMRLDLGIGEEKLSQETKKFFSNIQFTIQATLRNENIQKPLSEVVLSGSGAHITGITNFLENLLNCPCKVFQPHKIIQNGAVLLEKGSSIPHQFTVSLATAISSPITEDFNLGHVYLKERELKLFSKQLMVAAVLIGIILLSFLTYSFITLRSLNNEVEQSKKQVIQRLTQEFDLQKRPGKKSESLASIISATSQKLTSEEAIWFALSTANRFSFLHYLQELGTHINHKKLGLQMKRLTIKSDERSGEDTLTFEGTVRDYDALRTLEENLQDSHLFTHVPRLQETKINISLVIDKNGKGTT